MVFRCIEGCCSIDMIAVILRIKLCYKNTGDDESREEELLLSNNSSQNRRRQMLVINKMRVGCCRKIA